jgi:aspartyl protease family protein
MMSSGVGNLVKVMTGWGAAFALAAVVIVHIEDVRAALGLRLEPAEVGVVAGEAAEEPGARDSGQQHRLSSRSALLSRGRDGHFHADASINGRTLSVLVDTGATAVVLTYEDARTAGITVSPADFRYVSSTANGQARFARTVLADVRIGDVVVRNVEAAISQPGRLATTLLGMSFLGQLRMEMKGETLVLEQ